MSGPISSLASTSSITLEPIASRFFACHGLSLSVLRLDRIHTEISGNKWFKLQPALACAQRDGVPLLSFGGAWSNHLHALAYAGHYLGIETIGVVRGESANASNAMLTDARRWGMRLHFVSREEYRRRHDAEYLDALRQFWGDICIIPEGGSNAEAVSSVESVWALPALADSGCDYLVTAVGTGGTLAGLVAGCPSGTQVLGVPVLKYGAWLERDIESLLGSVGSAANVRGLLLPDGHQGGYARLTPELARMLLEVERHWGLVLDPVYTIKALMGLTRAVLEGWFVPGSHIVLLHTGGLQGRRGMQSRLLALAPDFVGPLPL
ncbi:1-aminocyclopropane-1-carboxylate deaminase/D-cysteine desulfhydrase [Marinobacterium marinum]|uniref:Pyridoxal-phosphate dependent enzyme n=1 Tax=Marinobacterium marinum TaxID=2756129 RepID=A0A7W1WXK6_9GAMM|nr:pyridoxal-phosphate dependent enzyme [Marinobacterium marinum]MBA4502083.1 pyridoxal-phosphate dependent enzyme [Marinobacterium marinum]